ncbi:MAG: L-threonylcarbamoyladenylate synthase [Firmicutes bacterium]|nr:L-threonylcarbamoyladenylate synthase [Bacillota bacterium]
MTKTNTKQPLDTKILVSSIQNIDMCAEQIKKGNIVAFATETVYGLGANALDAKAIKKIFEAKGRPSDNPLIVHVDSVEKIEQIAFVTEKAKRAVNAFMPGPLTIVLKKKPNVPDEVTAGLDTIAIRIPSHPVALQLIKSADCPIAAPSANISQSPSPTTAAHVHDDLSGKVQYILDGGSSDIGLESTVLDFSNEDKITLLREGGLPLEDLCVVLGPIRAFESAQDVEDGIEAPRCPGLKYKHYSPFTMVAVVEYKSDDVLIDRLKQLKKEQKKVLVLRLLKKGGKDFFIKLNSDKIVSFETVDEYAKSLFYEFREADKQEFDVILCQKAPAVGIGNSVNSRLEKAATC